jgi:hypothetical protein
MVLNQYEMNNWELLEDLFEERAAIIEYDGGFSTYEAEQMAAQALGFDNKFDFKSHIQELKAFA